MGIDKYFNNAIQKQMLDLHTAFLAKVISATDRTATIQPLGMIKQYGETAKKQAVLQNVPIAIQKIGKRTVSYVYDITTQKANGYVTEVTPLIKTEEFLELVRLEKGDIVVCVCCDRDITDARKGINSTPVAGHHSLSDSVIVGLIGGAV